MASDNKKACVPLEEREFNVVDQLKARIEKIQKNCDHDFRLIKEPKLSESLVRGVFVGPLKGPAQVSPSQCDMTLVCLKCSKEKWTSIISTCPRCLHSMGKREILGAGSRERYFGTEYLYFSAALSRCSNCGFTIAFDEWDQ